MTTILYSPTNIQTNRHMTPPICGSLRTKKGKKQGSIIDKGTLHENRLRRKGQHQLYWPLLGTKIRNIKHR